MEEDADDAKGRVSHNSLGRMRQGSSLSAQCINMMVMITMAMMTMMTMMAMMPTMPMMPTGGLGSSEDRDELQRS